MPKQEHRYGAFWDFDKSETIGRTIYHYYINRENGARYALHTFSF